MVRTCKHGNELCGSIKKKKNLTTVETFSFSTIILLQKLYLIFKTIKSLLTWSLSWKSNVIFITDAILY